MSKLPEFSFKSLLTFRALYESGSASKAAEALGVSQSGVSKSLALLEERLGIELFVRHKNRLIAKPEAKSLYHDLDKLDDAVFELEKNIESVRKFGVPRLRIAAIPALGQSFVPKILSAAFPEMTERSLYFDILSTAEIIKAVETDYIDVGIVTHPADSKSVRQEVFLTSEAVCVMAADHPFRDRESVHARDFSGMHLIVANQPNIAARKQLDLLEKFKVKVAGTTNCNLIAMCAFVAHSAGIGIINRLTAEEYITGNSQPGIIIKPFRPTIQYSFALAYIPQWKNSQTLTRIRQALKISEKN